MADGIKVPVLGNMPLRVKGDAVIYLSSLSQFHGISDNALIRLAERRTRMHVPDRWFAIALILSNRMPIPAPMPPEQPQEKPSEAKIPIKLDVMIGERIQRQWIDQ